MIQGGTALNIVPRDCSFDFEFRNIPGDDPTALLAEVKRYAQSTLLPEMHAVSTATGISFDEMTAVDGLDMPADHALVHLTQALTGANAVGKVSFCAEAGRARFGRSDLSTGIHHVATAAVVDISGSHGGRCRDDCRDVSLPDDRTAKVVSPR